MKDLISKLRPLTKGSKLNPYSGIESNGIANWEFPRSHIHGISPEKMEKLEELWVSHPEWQGQNGEQPNWDALFDVLDEKP
jgi:hypothetical protein